MALEHYTMINRPESPCRENYSDYLLKGLVKLPISPENSDFGRRESAWAAALCACVRVPLADIIGAVVAQW